MSIKKQVTLQKIVAHDFRYDTRIIQLDEIKKDYQKIRTRSPKRKETCVRDNRRRHYP